MKTLGPSYRAQVGALPVRFNANCLEVLLITSRDTGRWVIPKGWPMKGKADHDAAAQEAFEEAGVIGKVQSHPIGAYTYEKRLATSAEMVRVMVYRLDVSSERSDWPEKNERRRRWMTWNEAAQSVQEVGLSDILLRVGATIVAYPANR